MSKIGYEIKCPCCNSTDEYEFSSFNLFGDRLVLTHWMCNDYHISLDAEGVRQSFRYPTQIQEHQDKIPIYRFKEIK